MASDVLPFVAAAKGAEGAIQWYAALREAHDPGWEFNENDLNSFGYQLLNSHQMEQALKVFRLNVEEYPQSWNVYDSLGEAYMNAGQTSLAIQNYEKSMELNPKNDNGAGMLKKLKGQN